VMEMGRPPSAREASWTFDRPSFTPVCCSPDTSITSRVRSSQGMRGKETLRWISIRSPGNCYVSFCFGFSQMMGKVTSSFVDYDFRVDGDPSVI